ncbi:MAG: LytR family transcriptional regulator, partial [Mycobacterium sp.]|nr:LytR family transcriptional regulator [Mycobacterium sp.]
MSDGDNATPDQSGAPGDDDRTVRIQQGGSGRAPWERAHVPSEPTGTHSEGVAVADLIAKGTGSPTGKPPTRPRGDRAPGGARAPAP